MKRTLATAAIALLALGPVAAGAAGEAGFVQAPSEGDFLGTQFMGMSLYAAETVGEEATVSADMRAEWEDIGEIDDLLLTPEGQVKAVLVDIGGFLGIGERTVAVDMNELHMLTDENGDRFVTIAATRESLEAAPEFERPDIQTSAEAADPAVPSAGTATEADPMVATENAGTAAPPGIEREGYATLAAAELTADRLQGATVYDVQDEVVGEISKLVLEPDGRITEAVVDVGGFLGVGEYSVALSFDEMQVVNRAEDGDIRVYIDTTREALEQRPQYQG